MGFVPQPDLQYNCTNWMKINYLIRSESRIFADFTEDADYETAIGKFCSQKDAVFVYYARE